MNPQFKEQLEHITDNLFDELAQDIERVQKGKDTPAEYTQNVVKTIEHFQADVLSAHNQALRRELETLAGSND